MAAGKALAFLWQHGKAGHKDKELQNDLNSIIKGTYNDEVTGHRKKSTRSTSALGFVKTQKAAVNFQPPPPVFPEGKFFSFWNQMNMMDAATQYLEVLLKRLNELDRETLEGEEVSRIKISQRSWAFGLVYHSKEQNTDSLPGSPAIERAFRLPSPTDQYFNIKTTMKFTVLNTILVLALFHDLGLEKESTMRLLQMMKQNAGDRLNSTWQQTTVPDEVILSQLSEVIWELMCWPNPVGYHAILTFKAIAIEQRAPGNALRRRFMVSDARFLHKKMRGKVNPEFRCRTYVVLNLTCNDTLSFRSHLQCNNTNQDFVEDVMDAKLLLSLLMLDEQLTDESAEAALQKAIRSWLLRLPASMVSILYDALLEVMEDASQVKQESKAQEIRSRGILEIWQDLEQAKMLGKLPELVPRRELNVEFVAKRIIPIDFQVVAPDFKWRPVSTKVVEVHSQPGPMLARYSRTGAEQLLMDIIAKSLPTNSKGKELESSINPVKDVVRLLLGGGDGSLHYILAGYVGLVYSGHLAGGITTSGTSHSVDMLFYLVPLGQNNTLATYIAQRDLWYDATIYRPLVDRLPLIPHIRLAKDNEEVQTASTKDATHLPPTPSKLLTKQIQNYMLEANCLLKLSIYNCEGWYNYGTQHFHCTIPFLLRAEIGVQAASVCGAEDKTILHQESIPRTSLAPLDEESFQIFLSSYSLEAEATLRPIDWTGKEGEQKIKACSFTAIQAISVPRPSEARLGCNPCSHFLDICFLDSSNAKRLKDVSDIINYVSVYRTNWLIIQAQDTSKPFVILLDGELYGPFYRVRLSPCPHPSNRRYVLKFPIMTYWPTEVSRVTC